MNVIDLRSPLLKTVLLLIVLLISFNQIARSQSTGILKGTVTDKSTGEHLPFVNIVVLKADSQIAGASTDFNGEYYIKHIPDGIYSLKTSFVGYSEVRVDSIKISAAKITIQNIPMTQGVQIKMCVISSAHLIKADQRGQKQTREDIQKLPVNSKITSVAMSRSQVKRLQRKRRKSSTPASGVSSQNSGLGSVLGSRYGADIYIDGVKIRGNTNLPNSEVEEVDILSGEIPAEYGDVGGVLTAGELNDFSKWELWKDISEGRLEYYQGVWGMNPINRYPVVIKSEEGRPIVGAKVRLIGDGKDVWAAQTDNTGKAELWSNVFGGAELDTKQLTIEVDFDGETYSSKKVQTLKDGINEFEIPLIDCEYSNKVDIAFVVDATGSMSDEISYLKDELYNVINQAKVDHQDIDLNLGSMFYRCESNEYITRRHDLDSNIENTISFIREQYAAEGGEEAVEIALQRSVDVLNWRGDARTKLLFLVLDEPPGSSPDKQKVIHSAVKKAAEKGIRIIPVVASNISGNATSLEYLMRSLALLTNGTYAFLTDHSGVGAGHSEPVTNEYKVEKLNELLLRLINNYIFIPDCETDLEEVADTSFIMQPNVLAQEVLDAGLEVEKDSSVASIADSTRSHEDESQTGIQEKDEVLEEPSEIVLKYFPNPTSGILNVEFSKEVETLNITDITGKLVIQKGVKDLDNVKVDLSSYPVGMYILTCITQTGKLTGRIIRRP